LLESQIEQNFRIFERKVLCVTSHVMRHSRSVLTPARAIRDAFHAFVNSDLKATKGGKAKPDKG
jgi:hypothetical protein